MCSIMVVKAQNSQVWLTVIVALRPIHDVMKDYAAAWIVTHATGEFVRDQNSRQHAQGYCWPVVRLNSGNPLWSQPQLCELLHALLLQLSERPTGLLKPRSSSVVYPAPK